LVLSLVSTSPGTDRTPTIGVSGVPGEHYVEIYSDAQCTKWMGGGRVPANATRVEITVPSGKALRTAGTHTFYARITGKRGLTVPDKCSTSSVAYTLR